MRGRGDHFPASPIIVPMDSEDVIICSERNAGSMTPLIILLCIGIPHAILGFGMVGLGRSEPTLRIVGSIFCLSGTILLAISVFFFLGWLNRRIVADERGLTYTNRLGRSAYAPWDQVSVTDLKSTKGKLEFAFPDLTTSFSRSAKGFEDMRSYLRSRGKLIDKAGRREPLLDYDEVIDVEKLI